MEKSNKFSPSETPEKPLTKKVIIFGLVVIFVFIGGFSLWASLAPLESAAIAPGKITAAGYRRVIQHLEGGIVKAIYVKDGSKVFKNQVLLKLNNHQAKIALKLRSNEVVELLGVKARLIAEKNQAPKITFPKKILQQKSKLKVHEIIQSQTAIFIANKTAFSANTNLLKQQILQLKEEIKGITASNNAALRQLSLIKKEVSSTTYLEKRRLVEQSRLLALQREEAKLSGTIGENQAKIATLKQRIYEIQLKIIALNKEHQKEILTELGLTQQKLSDAIEKEKAAEDVLKRTTIYSPISGNVVSLQVHTIGGVIKPGEPIMDIVPNQEKLVVEAKIKASDIDVIKIGLLAKVQLSAFNARSTPTLLGEVTRISADILTDQKTGDSYYLTRVEIGKKQLKRLPKNQKLYSGMPAEVMIITGKLTPWQYFITPITQSFDKAFREK